MKFSSIVYSTALLVLSASVQAKLECSLEQTKMYESALDYSFTLQDMIDEASRLEWVYACISHCSCIYNAYRKPVVYLDSGLFELDPEKPIVLKKGVSLKGSLNEPTILTAKSKNSTASIEGKSCTWPITKQKYSHDLQFTRITRLGPFKTLCLKM